MGEEEQGDIGGINPIRVVPTDILPIPNLVIKIREDPHIILGIVVVFWFITRRLLHPLGTSMISLFWQYRVDLFGLSSRFPPRGSWWFRPIREGWRITELGLFLFLRSRGACTDKPLAIAVVSRVSPVLVPVLVSMYHPPPAINDFHPTPHRYLHQPQAYQP